MHGESTLVCCKCGEVICPECAVQTPVGFRCRDCANITKLPTFRVGTRHYVIAVILGLVLAVVFGIIWALIVPSMPYLNLLIGPAVGAGIGELISLAVNRKRGLWLAIIAGGSMGLCYLIEVLAHWGMGFYIFDLVGLGLSIVTAAGMLR
jgi:predicted outer membrane lipoprotein